MKIAVITRHAITNYGSLLQAFATQTVIERLGHSCEIIDYIREDETYHKREITLLKRKPNWNNNMFKRFIYLLLRQPESLVAGYKFERERKKMLHLSIRYKSIEELKANPPQADIFMTGSDQVWGPVENGSYDSSYCLSFTKEHSRRVAYAASFGHTKITNDLEEYYKKELSRFDRIYVREESAVQLIERLGLNSKQVLDPTLLLDSNYWEQYLEPINHNRYVLIYQLHNDKTLGKYAEKVAKERGLSLIRVTTSFHQINRPGKMIWCPSVGKFLSYIKNAECMITDSFHGTAFAINFNVPFVEILPHNNTETRNVSILRMTRLTSRILLDKNNTSLAFEKIDYSYSNQILKSQKEQSINLLKEMLEEI